MAGYLLSSVSTQQFQHGLRLSPIRVFISNTFGLFSGQLEQGIEEHQKWKKVIESSFEIPLAERQQFEQLIELAVDPVDHPRSIEKRLIGNLDRRAWSVNGDVNKDVVRFKAHMSNMIPFSLQLLEQSPMVISGRSLEWLVVQSRKNPWIQLQLVLKSNIPAS